MVVLICPIRLHLPVHVNSWVHTGGGYADTELAVTLGCARLKIRKHDVNGTVGLVLREIKLFKIKIHPEVGGTMHTLLKEKLLLEF